MPSSLQHAVACVTLSSVVSSGSNIIKTGAGTLAFATAVNTETNLTVENGTLLANGSTVPFGAAAALQINGGTYQQSLVGGNQAFATSGTSAFGGGGHIALQSAATFSSQLSFTGAFARIRSLTECER